MPLKEQVHKAVQFLKNQVEKQPKHAVVLGTGLRDIVDQFDIKTTIPLKEIPSFPEMTAARMDTSLYLVEYHGITAWILDGRLHYYEGFSMSEVTFPIRMLAEAGTRSFFLTNAAGNVNPEYSAGDLVLIRDHINWSFPSPLIGKNNKNWGPRYPDMIDIYHPATNQELLNYSSRSGIQLHTGVYLGLTGPQLETPAEYRLIHRLGADMVGMSTIPEVIVAAHMDLIVNALSVLSNDAVDKPQKASTDINTIMDHIQDRRDDVRELIQHWLGIGDRC